eukprot:1142589-Pelagomonas_calceolata.AAC.4
MEARGLARPEWLAVARLAEEWPVSFCCLSMGAALSQKPCASVENKRDDASSDKGALLGYMPSVYMEVVMDVMNTLCKVRACREGSHLGCLGGLDAVCSVQQVPPSRLAGLSHIICASPGLPSSWNF